MLIEGLTDNVQQPIKRDADGNLCVAGALSVDMSGVEIPPPVGGATEAKQDALIALVPAALTASGNFKVAIEEGGGGNGLTDAELRATAVPVSGPLTDTQLRATAVPVSLSSLPALAAGTNNIGDVDVLTLPALAAGENHVGSVGVTCAEVSATFARPNDTNAYTAKDAVANSTSSPTVLTFANCARNNAGCGSIVKARLFIDSATAMLGAAFRLHLYHTAPTAINDNAAFTLLYANKDKRVGYIDFPATTTEGSGSDCSAAMWIDLPVTFTCAAADNDLYGLLEITTAGAAPTAAHNIWIALTVQQN